MKKRIIAVVLAITLLVAGIPMTIGATSYEYTIKPGTGSDKESCVTRLVDALATHSANDKVTVYVSNVGEGETRTPRWSAWPNKNYHAATVTFTTKEGESKASLYNINDGGQIDIFGNTIFTNIKIDMPWEDRVIDTLGHSVTIDNTVDILYAGFAHYAKIVVGGRSNGNTAVSPNDGVVTLDGKSFDGGYSGVIIGATRKGVQDTIPGNQTIISKNNSINLYFSGSDTTTFSKNLDILLENAKIAKVAAKYADNGVNIVKGAVQILANGTSILDATAVYNAAVTSITADGGIYLLDSSNQGGTLALTDKAGTYAIDSDYIYAYAYDSVNYGKTIYYGTDTLTVGGAGNFEIGYTNDLSDITKGMEGEWVINNNGTITRGAKSGTYYVDPTGTGDGRTKDTPASDVVKVIKSINADGYTAGDIVTVYVSGGEGVSLWTKGTLASYTVDYSVMHNATLIFTSLDTTNRAKIAYDTNGASTPLVVKGPTIFRNIDIVDGDGWKDAYTNANNVTFENVTFLKKSDASIVNNTTKLFLGSSWNAGDYADYNSTVSIDNTVTGIGTVLFGSMKSANKSTIDNNETLSITDTTLPNLFFAGAETHAMTYNGDINVVLDNSKINSIRLTNDTYSPIFNGAIQFVSNNGSTYPDLSAVVEYANTNNVPYYVMNSGDGGKLAITEDAGKFAVESEYKYAYAYDSTANTVYYGDEILSVGASGNYSVGYVNSLSDIATALNGNWIDNGDGTMTLYADGIRVGKYYVQFGANGDGSSAESPLGSIQDVVAAVNVAGYKEGDLVTVYVMKAEGETNSWTDTATPKYLHYNSYKIDENGQYTSVRTNDSHTATLIFTSYDQSNVSNIAYAPVSTVQNFVLLLKGPTVFDNVRLITPWSKNNNYIYASGFDLEFKNVKMSCVSSTGTFANSDNPIVYAGTNWRNLADGTKYAFGGGGNIKFDPSSLDYFAGVSIGSTDPYGGRVTYTKDVTFEFNGSTGKNVYLHPNRNGNTKLGLTFEKNLNFFLNGASINNYWNVGEVSEYTFKGAVQFILTNNSNMKDFEGTNMETIVATGVPIYKLNIDGAADTINYTETAGKYTIKDGYTAIAVDDTDSTKQYASENGILTVPQGSYSVMLLDGNTKYLCDGKIINVYVPCTIDFSDVKPDIYSVEDKVFVGWKIKSTGEYATSETKLNMGEVLEAQYIDCKAEDFGVNTEIRTVGEDGLRFIVNVSNSFINALPNAGERGSIVIPTDNARGRDIFLDENVIYDWTWDGETRMNFTANEIGETPVAVKAVNMFENGADQLKYTLCITGIPEANYDRYYTMRGYIKYVDYNGIERVAYTPHANTSLYHTAVDTIDSVSAPFIKAKIQAIVDYVEITLKAKTLNASKQLLAGYEGCADTNPNHKLYYQNGVYVREVSINSGKKLSSPITIAAFSDLHFNHINMRDIEEGRETILSTYRGRLWNKNGNTVGYTNTTINLAKYHDKAIVVGDIMDYLSWGCADVMQRALIDKFTKNKLTMVLGNHEQTEILQADMGGLSNTLTDKEIDEWLYKYWINDMYYSSEIMKDSSGADGVMIVTMMNGWDVYYESQRIALEADIATARAKNIPILIFEHNPISTRNPNESTYPIIPDRTKFGTEENHSKYLDFKNNYAGNASGNKGSDATTLSVYNLIVQNYDIIKGVFHAHEHVHTYTEIMAQDKNGNFIPDGNGGYITIPQYGMFAVAESGGAMISVTVN